MNTLVQKIQYFTKNGVEPDNTVECRRIANSESDMFFGFKEPYRERINRVFKNCLEAVQDSVWYCVLWGDIEYKDRVEMIRGFVKFEYNLRADTPAFDDLLWLYTSIIDFVVEFKTTSMSDEKLKRRVKSLEAWCCANRMMNTTIEGASPPKETRMDNLTEQCRITQLPVAGGFNNVTNENKKKMQALLEKCTSLIKQSVHIGALWRDNALALSDREAWIDAFLNHNIMLFSSNVYCSRLFTLYIEITQYEMRNENSEYEKKIASAEKVISDFIINLNTKDQSPTITEEAHDLPVKVDNVNNPAHYKHPSGIECIDIARDMSFNLGNVLKYIWRAGKKDKAKEIEDLHKALVYLNNEIDRLTNAPAKVKAN